MRPSWIEFRVPFETTYFGVKWRIYEPEVLSFNQPWIDGPYCPKCDEELEEINKGIVFKKDLWTCKKCIIDYERPKGDLKNQVIRNFSKQQKKTKNQ